MKRFFSILLTVTLLLGMYGGCEPSTPQSVVMKGYPYTVSEGNQMTVTEAVVEGNSIVVKLSVEFASATLQDLKGIAVRKGEVEQPDILCDVERTTNRNDGKDVFAQKISGEQEVFLVFTDNSIYNGIELSNYILSVPVGHDSEGNMVLQDAMALG